MSLYPCPICKRPYDLKNSMLTHFRRRHRGDPFAYCTVCDLPCESEHKLQQHVAEVHEGKSFMQCPLCDKKFANTTRHKYNALWPHIRIHHPDSRTHKCNRCGLMSNHPGITKEHKLAAHYPPNLICPYPGCQIQCSKPSEFDEHYQSLHATLDEKLAFSINPAKRWLYKLYFIRFIATNTFKIGITERPLKQRLGSYVDHVLVEAVQLPLRVNQHRCFAHQIENRIHLEIARKGFENIGESPEFFNFWDCPDDETELICDVIDDIIEQNILTEPLRLVSNVSPNKLYLFYSEGLQRGKVGFTTQLMRHRLRQVNHENKVSVATGDNFRVVDKIFVDPAATMHEMKAWENEILIRMYAQFPEFKKFEYFQCRTEDVGTALSLFHNSMLE